MNKKYNYNIGDVHNKQKIVKLFYKNKRLYALCECIECGKIKEMRASDLFNKKCNSCVCQIYTHNLSNTKIYSIYHNMKDRCYNPNNHVYNHYGGRGIQIYDKWLNNEGFLNFYNWSINNGYKEGLSIDRINIDGNYEPNNCRWIPLGENVALSNKDHPRIKKYKKHNQ